MNSDDLQKQVFMGAQEYGVSTVLFRNATGRKLGLNIADVECLSLIFLKGISTPTELARYTGITAGSATAMLDRLEKAKLIKRSPNPNDRRGVMIEPNEQSTETIGPMVAEMQKRQKELIASYSDKELEVIADFLSRFAGNVKDYTETIENDLT
jgi:DNA-binding MarR family transcriptional regulator